MRPFSPCPLPSQCVPRDTSLPRLRMSRPRRRSSVGITLGVVIALLLAAFAMRTVQTEAPLPSARRDAAVAAPAGAQARAGEAGAQTTAPVTTTGRGAKGFASRQRLVEHFEKHGEEFPGFSMTAYLAAAQRLRDAPAGGDVLEVRRRDGVVTRFDRGSGAFLAVNRDGTIRTFFRPNDGEAYFRRQASRLPRGVP